jgi:hypothetical protein
MADSYFSKHDSISGRGSDVKRVLALLTSSQPQDRCSTFLVLPGPISYLGGVWIFLALNYFGILPDFLCLSILSRI